MSLTFSEYNKDFAKRILSKGATIPVACKILGNNRLSQSKTKKELGLDQFMYAGRPSRGRARIFYSQDEMDENDVVYPINEMNNFNSRLADELKYFHLFGYSIQNIEYEKHHRIARLSLVAFTGDSDENAKCEEFPLTFIDLSEIRYLQISKDSEKDRNIFVLPSPTKEDLDSIAVAQEQEALLKLPLEEFCVVVATNVAGKEYYELNEKSGKIFDSHSFLKRGGEYEQRLLKYELDESDSNADLGILLNDEIAQSKANGFSIRDGRIKELNEDNNEIKLSDYYDWLNDHFKDEFVIASRYFDRRYLPETDTAMTDSIIDHIAATISDKELVADTFAEFEFNAFSAYLDYLNENEDKEEEDEDEGLPGGIEKEKFDKLFSGKTQSLDEREATNNHAKESEAANKVETKAEANSDEAKATEKVVKGEEKDDDKEAEVEEEKPEEEPVMA